MHACMLISYMSYDFYTRKMTWLPADVILTDLHFEMVAIATIPAGQLDSVNLFKKELIEYQTSHQPAKLCMKYTHGLCYESI